MRPWSRPSPLLRRLAAPHRHFDIHRKINFAQKYPPLLCCCLTRQHLFRRILKNSIQYYYYLHQQRKSFFYTLRRCVGCLFGCNFFLQATNTLIITHNICMDVSVSALKSAERSINLNPLTWTLVRLTAQNLTENWPHFSQGWLTFACLTRLFNYFSIFCPPCMVNKMGENNGSVC